MCDVSKRVESYLLRVHEIPPHDIHDSKQIGISSSELRTHEGIGRSAGGPVSNYAGRESGGAAISPVEPKVSSGKLIYGCTNQGGSANAKGNSRGAKTFSINIFPPMWNIFCAFQPAFRLLRQGPFGSFKGPGCIWLHFTPKRLWADFHPSVAIDWVPLKLLHFCQVQITIKPGTKEVYPKRKESKGGIFTPISERTCPLRPFIYPGIDCLNSLLLLTPLQKNNFLWV